MFFARRLAALLIVLAFHSVPTTGAKAVQPGEGRVTLAQLQPDPNRQLADVVARIAELEDEVRRLRGRVEELEFRQRSAGQSASTRITVGRAADDVPPPGRSSGLAAPSPAAPGTPEDVPPTEVARADPNAPPREQYETALGLLQRGEWTAAESAFDTFLQRFPDDQLAANAAYWLGETYYIRQDYADAAAIFARNYRSYGPEAAKAPDNLLKLGMSLSSLGDRERACQTFAELQKRHADAAVPVRQAVARESAAAGCS